MSKKATGLVELYLGPSGSGKRGRRQSLVGGTVVEDYNSNLHGGRVVVVRLVPKAAKAPKVKKPTPAARAMAGIYPNAQPEPEVTVG